MKSCLKRLKKLTGFQHLHLLEFMVCVLIIHFGQCLTGFDKLGQYLSLDTDHNGMLNKEELMR